MQFNIQRIALVRFAWIALVLGCGALGAQEPAARSQGSSVVRLGYSRPGSPEDPLKGDKVVALALNPDFKGKLVGGTIFYGVFKNIGKEGDAWGTGMPDFNERFVMGKDPHSNVSPGLDTKARYLYLYQIVNDRGMDPLEIAPAIYQDIRSGDIAGLGLKLPVDPKRISSWGHFKNSAFALPGDQQTGNIRMAVSAAPSILGQLPQRRYQDKAPAVSLMSMAGGVTVAASNLNLKESPTYKNLQEQKGRNIGLVNFQANFMKAAESGREPEYVQITTNNDADKSERAEFHVLWKGANVLKIGQHSVLVGFTSDLGPTDEKGQLEAADAFKGSSVRPVSAAEGDIAIGTMPVPQPAAEPAAGNKARTPLRSGYTRPGNPPDEMEPSGKIRPIAYVGGSVKKVIGGTVYFSVFERVGLASDGDAWGTGLGNLNEMFVEGQSFRGGFSPHLDTRGRYLYLYQLVNDRGLDRSAVMVAPAADDKKDLNTTDIAGYALRLSVDPRYITSWGYFKNAAFTAEVPNRGVSGEIVPAADGGDSKIALAVSSFQPILSDIPEKRYRNRSPALPLPADMVASWGVGAGTLNLKMVEDARQLARMQSEGIKLVGFEQNKLNAASSAKTPEFVQILYASGMATGFTETAIGSEPSDEIAPVVFRVDFRNPLKPGEHSVVFGFTTDLPPQDEPLRIEDPVAAATGIRAVGFGDGVTPGTGIAPAAAGVGAGVGAGTGIVPAAGTGVAPGPVPAAAQAATGGSTGVMGGLSGMGGAGFGGGGFPAVGGGGLGGARSPGTGGGGGGITGGGEGDQGQNGNQDQNQNTKGDINFNVNLKNEQNNNNCCCCDNGGGNVIPEPGSVILAVLGTPGLYYLWRRRKPATLPLATN